MSARGDLGLFLLARRLSHGVNVPKKARKYRTKLRRGAGRKSKATYSYLRQLLRNLRLVVELYGIGA